MADPDRSSREALTEALEADPGVEVVDACGEGKTAVERIRDVVPDLVALEVELPEIDGFGVIEAIGADRMPATVLLSRSAGHALHAFEVGAIHYLLKPLDDARVREAVRRARSRLASPDDPGAEDPTGGPPLDAAGRFVVRGRERIRLVPPDGIDWIEAYGNYVRLHEGDRSHVVRATLTGVADRLDSSEFARVHRSTIVRVDRVTELVPWFGGDYEAVLRDGTRLKVSRRYKTNLLPDE